MSEYWLVKSPTRHIKQNCSSEANKLILSFFPYWLIGISVFVYLCLRAYYIPITHDEASAFLVYVTQPLSNTFLGIPPIAANHILHTLLVKCSVFLFGNEMFFLRLPVLLSYLLYFFFSLRLLQRLTSKPFWVLVGLVSLHFHPYLLEFFALSRGYGLSIALTMASIHYVLAYCDESRFGQLFAAVFWGALTVYGNFSFGFYYISLIAFLFFHTAIRFRNSERLVQDSVKPKPIVVIVVLFFISIILVLLCFIPLNNLLINNAFYFGGTTDFIGDTVGSLIRWNLYGQQYFGGFDLQIIGGLFLGSIGLAFLWGLIAYFAGYFSMSTTVCKAFNTCDNQALKGIQIFGILLASMVFFSICHVYLFEGKYAVGRTALFFFPLSLLLTFTFLLCWQEFFGAKIGAFLWAAMLTVHLLQTFSVRQSYEWILDAETPAMLDFVQQQAAAEQKILSLGVHWLMLPSVDYYQYLEPLQGIEVYSDKKLVVKQYDYYYLHENHADLYLEGYKIVRRFGEGRILLLSKQSEIR